MESLQQLLRWIHVLAGVIWIGHLYFFNFVNGPFAGTMNADTKKAVVPELMPRALYFFRWGAAWTWATGVLLLLLVFYHQAVVRAEAGGLGMATLFSLVLTFGGFAVYDTLMSGSLIADQKMKNAAAFALVVLVMVIMTMGAGFGHRSLNIHIGSLFGTTMAFNVWFRIWPSQQQIITAIKNGQAPDAKVVALAGLRSRHNTYLSVPLLWTMLNAHSLTAFPRFVPDPVALMIVILVGWHLTTRLYAIAGNADKVKSGL
ncbi:MAG: urate hydroxylase PuuD [Deltaproteobacteria bacterium]|nr:urate hydroxylase PuuD [Deltaproteobacteria bacterium]